MVHGFALLLQSRIKNQIFVNAEVSDNSYWLFFSFFLLPLGKSHHSSISKKSKKGNKREKWALINNSRDSERKQEKQINRFRLKAVCETTERQ